MTRFLLAAGAAVACQAGITAVGAEASPWAALALYLAATAASLAAMSHKAPLALLVAAALAMRLAAWPLEPSDDVNRYLAEGRMILQGINPYAVPPLGFDGVNHPEMTAIYPPLTQAAQAAVAALWPDPRAFKLLYGLCDLGVFAMAVRLGGPKAGAAVALSPLLATWVTGRGHNESLWIALLLGALALARHPSGARPSTADRCAPAAAAALVGAAVAAKTTALFAVPFLLAALPRKTWPVAAATVALAYLPFAAAGWGLVDSLARFTTEFRFNSLLPLPLGAVLLALVFLRRDRNDLPASLRDGAGATLLALPTLHPWYGCVLVPLCGLRPRTPWWALLAGLGACFLYHLAIAREGRWVDTPWVRALVFGPVLLAWAAAWRRGRTTTRDPGSP